LERAADQLLSAALSALELADPDTRQVATKLAELRALALSQGDASLVTLVTAAEEVATEWSRRRHQAQRSTQELRELWQSITTARARLRALLHLIGGTTRVGTSPEYDSPPFHDDRPAGRRRWLPLVRGTNRTRSTPPVTQSHAHRNQELPDRSFRPPAIWTSEVETAGDSVKETAKEAVEDAAGSASPPPNLEERAHTGEITFPLIDEDSRTSKPRRPHDGRIGSHPVQQSERVPTSADLAVVFLGSFGVFVNGRRVEVFTSAKSLRIFKYLLAHRSQPVQRDVLIDLFWPNSDVDNGRHNLQQAMYVLRKTFRAEGPYLQFIKLESDSYVVNPDLSFWSDVEEFEEAASQGRRAEQDGHSTVAVSAYERAERAYAGDYLMDTPYEDWAISHRERLRLVYLDVANRLADIHLVSGDLESAVLVSRRILHFEPCDERVHRRLIKCYGVSGQRNLVIRQYRNYVDCMERVLGLGPDRETTALYESLINQRSAAS
jgi:DNA-binding SARP family transcriptional activator